MNVAAIVRHLEQGGFSHDQAISLSEVFQDEVIEKIATKEYVDLVIKREIALLENRITSKFNTLIMWLAASRSCRRQPSFSERQGWSGCFRDGGAVSGLMPRPVALIR